MTTQCAVCEKPLSPTWTDTHGVGACWTCGMPYTIYHYENDKRVDKPPSPAIKDEWIEVGRRYWAETHRRVFPGAYDMGVLRSRGNRTYSGATEGDMSAWDEWCEAHKAELPAREAPAEEEAATYP